MSDATGSRRRQWATAVGLGVGGLAYLLTLLDFSHRLTRTANALGYASNFFDFQGRAFLAGHLYVTRGDLGIEGFERGGHEYMYFPPFPALLRIPVLMTTHEYDGKLTLLSMGLAFVLMAVMTAKLVWLVRDLVVGADLPLSRFEASAWACFLALATGGTVLTFNASLPWVYHEVYAWAVPLVIGSTYWMTRVVLEPRGRSVAWLGAFALCTILTRTTGGWAVCLTSVALGLWLVVRPSREASRRLGLAVVAAGSAALAIGITYNMLKFDHPYLFPLQDQVWTTLNSHRREALAVNGGTITGPQFFETSLVNYFRPEGIRFVGYFPWITLPAEPARAYGGAFIDQSYRTGSVTSFMPLLLLLTVVAVPVLVRPGAGDARRALTFPFVAAILVTGGVMGYGYLAYRYTCEFVPALVLGGAIGLAGLLRFLVRRGGVVRATLKPLALATLTIATAFGIAANMLTGFASAAVTAGGPDLARYLDLQRSWAWPGPAPEVLDTSSPPSGGHTDDLAIQGNCDALWVNTGDAYATWQLVERRSLVFVVRLAPDFGRSGSTIATAATSSPDEVVFQTDKRHRARLLIRNETGTYNGPWFDITPPGVVRIGIGDRPELGYAEVTSTPGGFVGYVRSYEWSPDWLGAPVEITATQVNQAHLARRGIDLRTEPGVDLPLCKQIQRDRTSGG